MPGLIGQLVGVALIYLAFRLLKRHADKQEPSKKHLSKGDEQRRTTKRENARPFPRDELPMPTENRVGRDDRGDLTESATAQPVSVYGQSTPSSSVRRIRPRR